RLVELRANTRVCEPPRSFFFKGNSRIMATYNAPDAKGVLVTTTVTIANGTALSPAVDLTAYTLVALQLPSGWTAAGLTFQAANDNQNFGDVYDKNGEYAHTAVDVSRLHSSDPNAC